MRCRGKLCCCEREGEVAGKEDPVAGAAAVVVVVVVVVRDARFERVSVGLETRSLLWERFLLAAEIERGDFLFVESVLSPSPWALPLALVLALLRSDLVEDLEAAIVDVGGEVDV